MRPRTALTIAGSDSGGGAGIQADLKTFSCHGVFGMSAIAAITAQNTRGVTRVDPVPPEGLRAQLEAVLADLPVDAIKIGMLGSAAHVAVVAEVLAGMDARPPVVLDPVMVSTSGSRLLDADAERILAERLLPLATLATPNLPEAAVLAGADASEREALEAWARTAPCAVLITGGDAAGDEVVDTLVVGGASRTWRGPKLGPGAVHGTGCTLSSAIAARLALGTPLEQAIDGAITWIRAEVSAAVALGGGPAVLRHRTRA